MAERVLVTGGAGFIGSHVCDALLAEGYDVRVLDALVPQVHGRSRRRPSYLDPRVELREGDVRDRHAVRHALLDVDLVVHLAAAVGVGQSGYAMEEYVGTNDLGTAVLLEQLIDHSARRLVVASSMSVYGEGRYVRDDGSIVDDARRDGSEGPGRWDPAGDLHPVPTPEDKRCDLASVYALNKFVQERMCLLAGRAFRRPTVALRLFNVYGPRQALANPYTGVLAIFAARLLADRAPVLFEDGLQRRDFVSVHDVARAFVLAVASDVDGAVLNIGSGVSRTVAEVAQALGEVLGREIPPQIPGKGRFGDVRHCFADIGRAQSVLGYTAQVSFADGLAELAADLEAPDVPDGFDAALVELDTRGLTR